MMNSEIKEKSRKSFEDRYGGISFASPSISNQIKQTILERYGVENAMNSEEVRNRAEETSWRKYGNKFFKGSLEDFKQTLTDPSKAELFLEFKQDPENFILSHFEYKPTLTAVSNLVGCTPTTISFHILKDNLKHLIEYKKSTVEVEMFEFLKQYVCEEDISINNRSAISPSEIDFYLPNYHLGIECNPTYTHNSSIGTHYDESLVVTPNYHRKKTIDCESKGIKLIHVFGYQWSNRPDVVKSMIVNSLGKTPSVYYARNLNLKIVSDAESRMFLGENHIQGYTSGKVRLGLYDDNLLISLMVLSRKRSTIGYTSTDTEDDWELSRFCTKKYSRCVGGASKLFKYFINTYHPNSIVSFSDRSYTSGGVYPILGFEFDSYTPPGYVWVDTKTDFYYNRVVCQKRNLRKLFNDPSIDIENKTEAEIMEEHGFVKVYNSGLAKWMWRANK